MKHTTGQHPWLPSPKIVFKANTGNSSRLQNTKDQQQRRQPPSRPSSQKKYRAQKQHYDKSSKPLNPLTQNQVVRLQTRKGHDKIGVICKICAKPLSFVFESNGKQYRHNRQHLLPVNEPQPNQDTTQSKTWTCINTYCI